ncbi:MAG: VOC family protein [Pseudomonadota bacterium]
MKTLRAMPVFPSPDVRRVVSFYETLGFQNHGFWGEGEELFAIVQRGDVSMAFAKDGPDDAPPNRGRWAAYLYVSDVDALHAELAALDPPEITAPTDQLYGCRDFDLVDVDGRRIAFGQDVVTEEGLPGLGPERGRG